MNKGGQKPYVINAGPLESQVDQLISIIKTKGLTDVGIFVARKVTRAKVHELLEINGFQHLNLKDDSEGVFAEENQKPILTSFHSSKGLQFESVFILDYCDEFLSNKFWINPLYVAMTRTYNSLFILHDDNAAELLSRVPGDQYLDNLSDNDFDFEI